MITAQDIREKGFERARINGYDMASVDEFLEELADDVAATQKENAVLKSKMKVLVDKIEEYRSNEDALNAALLSAQKLAVQIENEARQRAAATIAEAEQKAQETIGSITDRAKASGFSVRHRLCPRREDHPRFRKDLFHHPAERRHFGNTAAAAE